MRTIGSYFLWMIVLAALMAILEKRSHEHQTNG